MVEPQVLVVEEPFHGARLDKFLAEHVEDYTRSNLKNMIENEQVLCNEKLVTKAGTVVKKGDVISIVLSPKVTNEQAIPEDIPLDVVYEDNDLAVINKPQGMTVHPAVGNWTGTLVNALLFKYKTMSDTNGNIRPGIVHRLDKDTSGLMVVAKNNKAHVALAEQIANKTCHREYIALVEGNVKQETGDIVQPISRDKKDRLRMAVDPNGKYAKTHFEVLEHFDTAYTLVKWVLSTGRTHQIRVHAKWLGHPIVGDPVYGFHKQKFALNGQLLHAVRLEFVHPTTGKKMQFEAPLPLYFANVLDKLRKQFSKR